MVHGNAEEKKKIKRATSVLTKPCPHKPQSGARRRWKDYSAIRFTWVKKSCSHGPTFCGQARLLEFGNFCSLKYQGVVARAHLQGSWGMRANYCCKTSEATQLIIVRRVAHAEISSCEALLCESR